MVYQSCRQGVDDHHQRRKKEQGPSVFWLVDFSRQSASEPFCGLCRDEICTDHKGKEKQFPFPDCYGSCHDNDDNDKNIIEYLITSICIIGHEMPPSAKLLRPWLDAFLIIPPQCRVVHVAWGQKSPHSTSAYHCEGPRNQSCDHKVLRSCPPH